MKTKIIKVACRLGKPFRISKRKDFSLKDVDGISRSGQRQIAGTRDCERQIVEEVADRDQAMRTITNDYKDAQILNLGSEGERGPYLVTQTGIAPSDPLLKTRMFVLRPDGYWVDFNAYASQGKPEAMDEIVFPSTVKVMETFGKLFGRPRVLDLPIDERGLNAWIERHSSDPLEAVRGWVAQYKARHRKDTGG